jgi:hypothetical protein
VTLADVLHWGSMGLLCIGIMAVAVTAWFGVVLFVRDTIWPALVAARRWVRRWRERRKAWRDQRRSQVARALRDQVVARREGR